MKGYTSNSHKTCIKINSKMSYEALSLDILENLTGNKRNLDEI